jgi:Mg/Co/Ni transporter MgtE
VAVKIEALLRAKDYAALEKQLSALPLKELAAAWPRLGRLDKLVVFKLLDAPRALELYGLLPFDEKYYLLCGFPLQSIAPVLEDLALAQRRHFVQLPRESYDVMFRQLALDKVAAR